MIQLQDAFIADLIRCDQITTRYGNQRKARAAARERFGKAMSARGYSEAQIRRAAVDAYDIFTLQRDEE
jgi:hypothetical protein